VDQAINPVGKTTHNRGVHLTGARNGVAGQELAIWRRVPCAYDGNAAPLQQLQVT
jgi:hypothetical protein